MSKEKKNTKNKATAKQKATSTAKKATSAVSPSYITLPKVSIIASLLVGIIALGLSFLQYGQSIPYEFVLDDKIVLNENSFVKEGLAGIDDLLLTEGFVGYFGEQKDLIPGARYRPLSLITFALEYEIMGGLNSSVNHVVNIILYAFCCWLLFYVLAQLYEVRKEWWLSIPFLAFLLFCSHAVHTEVVANIKSRDEIMSLIFSLLALLWSVRYMGKGNPMYLIGAILSFFLGLLSKETTLTFLAIIPAGAYLCSKWNGKRMLIVMAGLLVTLIGYLLLRHVAIGYLLSSLEVTDVMNNPFVGMDFMERMATVFYTLLKYLGLTFVPYPLTHDYYPFQIPRVGWGNIVVLLSLMVHLGIGALIVFFFRKKKAFVFPLFLYVASLSIASNIVINVGTTMNERFLFTPTVGTCIATALLFTWFVQKFKLPKILPVAIIGLISIVYLAISYNRTQVWENALTLNRAAVQVSTNSARANSFMATALYNDGLSRNDRKEKKDLLIEAEAYAKRAIEIYPSYQNANLMLAGIAGERHKLDGDLDAILQSFKMVATRRPEIPFLHEYIDYLIMRGYDTEKMLKFFYETGYNELVVKNGNNDWGIKYLQYGLELSPNDPRINFGLSKAFRARGNDNEANLYLSKAVSVDPSYQNK